MVIMKAEMISLIIIVIWSIIGHFFPSITLLLNALLYFMMFILSEILLKYNMRSDIFIVFALILVFINDFLFRLFGGGINDDVGKVLVEISFYFTLLSTIVSILIIIGIRGDLVGINILKYIVYIVALVITLLIIYSHLYGIRIY